MCFFPRHRNVVDTRGRTKILYGYFFPDFILKKKLQNQENPWVIEG